MLVVYAMLGHAGAETGTVYPGLATGAEVLTALAQQLFGRAGLVLIAAIFVIACFNTCVGLIACVGQYFHQLLPRIPYPALAAFFAVASMLVSNLGLAAIIRLSTPVLNAIYPAAIVLILLSFMPGLEKAPGGVSAVHGPDRPAEHRRCAAAGGSICRRQRSAAGQHGLWLGTACAGRACWRAAFKQI